MIKKQHLIQKYLTLLNDFNNNNFNVYISINTIALMCANMEFELLQTCHFKSTEKTTNYIVQNVINGLGVSR
ncbi:MAG: hypothetical protein ACNI28_09185 [Arcobacter sp.]|uniref:hypothetical protein n=1 Tax=Arcobacter sp. TaxID=1872629 RepID=UPI003B005046